MTNSQFDVLSKPLIQSFGWQTIEQLIDRQSRLMVFKCLNDLDILAKFSSKTLTTPHATTDLRLPLKSSPTGQKCFSFRGAKIWNSLSTEVKQASSLDAFKNDIYD